MPSSSAKALSFAGFNAVLDSARGRFDKRARELRGLVADKPVYLFGYGGKGRTLASQIAKGSTTRVIVYDSNARTRDLAARDGFSTMDRLADIGQDGNGVILGACQAQMEQAAIVPGNHIFYQEAAWLFDAPHLESRAREFSSWVPENREPLYRMYQSIHPESCAALLGVLSFRLSLDPRDLIPARRQNSDMWFDVLEDYATRRYSTFLDVGAYDGDTLRQAQRRLSVTRGIAVEANTTLFDSIRRIGTSYVKGVDVVPRAAWSHACRLHFSEIRGGMISVSEAPDGELEAGPIDDAIREQVDLIKMDIEGAEIPALRGSLRTLKSGPDLAIAAYHRPDDLVQLPAFLGKAGYTAPAFDLHIRHYSDCFDDTILYCLKR
jgi:FkbM family methyltransferase